MLGQLLGDASEAVMRILGRASKKEKPLNPNASAEEIVAALHSSNPEMSRQAIASMDKLHYGSFYRQKNFFRSAPSRGMFSGLAEQELLKKGKGFSGAVFGRPAKGLSVGIEHFKYGPIYAGAQGIFEAMTAPQGHKVSALAGGAIKGMAFATGDLIGSTLAGPIGGWALGAAFEHAASPVEGAIQMFTDFNKQIKHVNMGGNYEDTRIAYTMRQRAAQEMGSSSMNARSWLGQESVLLHQ
jgi:hypothetical protein